MAKKKADSTKKFFEILTGLVLIFLGVYGIVAWWWDELFLLIKGGIGLVIVLIGLMVVLVATES